MYIANKERYETMKYNRCGKSGLLLPAFFAWFVGTTSAVTTVTTIWLICLQQLSTLVLLTSTFQTIYGPYPGSAEENFGRF